MSSVNPALEAIRKNFAILSYEPVLDSDSALKSWIQTHSNGLLTSIINGEFVSSTQDELKSAFQVKNPYNGETLAHAVPCTQENFSSAVQSCLNALESWRKLTMLERGKIIYNMARNVQKHLSILVACESLSSGRSSREVKDLDLSSIIKALYYYSGSASLNSFENYDSLGVVAICGHYDNSLLTLVNKLAAALITGNTCLIVPHKLSLLSACMFPEICAQSGLPNGVLNLLISNTDALYGMISNDSRISCVSFDGRSQIGQNLIAPQCSLYPHKQTLLSLDGKSSMIIYESADLDSAIETIVDGCFYSNGQHRYSLNKVFVQEPVFEIVSKKLEVRFRKLRVGNHLDKCNDFSVLVSQNDVESFRQTVANQSNHFGAQVKEFVESINDSKNSSLIAPTIIKNISLNSEFNLSELNGPYVMVLPFRTVKESIELVNNSRLSSAVCLYSQNISLVMEVSYLVNVGTVWINSFPIEKGVQTRKQSGNYEITGFRSLRNFLRPKFDRLHSFEFEQKEFDKVLQKYKSFGQLDLTQSLPVNHSLNLEKTYKLYIGGKQTRPDTQSSRTVFSSTNTDEPYCLMPDSSRKDVRNAVEAAHSAFNSWWKRSNFNKAQILYYFGENLASRSNELSKKLELFAKKSKEECEYEMTLCSRVIFYFASLCDKYVGKLNDTTDYGYLMEIKEPLGCIAILCGHDSSSNNSPLLQFVLHLVAAISHGNTVVIVPDERFPLPALDLYEIFDTSDMPGGVVNILTGSKQHLAKHLCEHQQVSSLWYLYDLSETKTIEQSEKVALQFLRYTSSFSLKRTWFASSDLAVTELDRAGVLSETFLKELELNATQSKFVHIPMGTIFAN